MSKVLIFGSTGMTGLCAVQEAVDKGLKVKVFVRDPEKLPSELKSKVDVAQGDVLNYQDVLKAMKDVNSVCVILGTRNDFKPTTVISEGTKNIVKAMKESNIDIVSFCLSAFLFYEPEKIPALYIDITAEHQRQFDVVKASGLKYITVLPPEILENPGTGYEIAYDIDPGRVVSKYDLAKFLIDSLSQPEHCGKVCGIKSKTI